MVYASEATDGTDNNEGEIMVMEGREQDMSNGNARPNE